MFNESLKKYRSNDIVILEDGNVYSYQDLEKFSIEVSRIISRRALVFCLCKNNIETIFAYASFIINRMVTMMIDESTQVSTLQGLCDAYNPQYIWLPNEKIGMFPEATLIFSFQKFSLLKFRDINKECLHKDLAVLLSTSGSTGSPKFVRISYRNLEANARSIVEYSTINHLERPITTLPMSYSFGLSIINSHLIEGATILLTEKSVMERGFWSFLKNQRASSLSGVPYTFEMLKRLGFFNMNLPHLKTLTQAGGKMHYELSKELSLFCQKNKKKMFFMYGQTEASPRMSYLPPSHSISKIGSIGIAIPRGKFSLIDDQGKNIEKANDFGELVFEGENVSMGYADCAQDLLKGDENNGILKTGDIARRDADGFFYIVGRKNRFIKIYGNRVNLDEAEQIIRTIAKDVACVGCDDKMVIYITENNLVDQVRRHIASKTNINFRAFEIRVISAIPKSSSGKINYRNLEI